MICPPLQILFGWSKKGDILLVGEHRNTYRILVGKPEGWGPFRTPRLGWKDILNWILKKYNLSGWTELLWLRIETVDWLL